MSDWEKIEAVYEKLRENSELVKRIRKASSYRELLVELTEELERRLGVKVFWNEHMCTADDDIVFAVDMRADSNAAGRIVICVFEGRDIEVEVRLDG